MDLALQSAASFPSLGGMDYAALQAAAAQKKPLIPGLPAASFGEQLDRIDQPAPVVAAGTEDEAVDASEEADDVAPTMSLVPSNAAEGLPAVKKADEVETDKTEETTAPKIARSWDMESADRTTHVSEDADISWDDFIDFINPLQHIPVIGTIYREVTGDTIKPSVKIAGDIAFGAATGSLIVSTVAGIISSIYEEHTGEEPTIQVAQALFGDDVVGAPAPEAGQIDLAAAEEAAQQKADAAAQLALQSKPAEKQEPVVAASTVVAERSLPKKIAKPAALPPSAALALAEASGRGLGQRTMRVGKKLIVKPAQQNVETALTAQSAAPPKEADAKTAEAQAASVARLSSAVDGSTLAAMMQQQGQAKAAGEDLPPMLVQDMMLMALDKYRAAQGLTDGAAQSAVQ